MMPWRVYLGEMDIVPLERLVIDDLPGVAIPKPRK
jgi:hypothetical protein